MSDVKGVIRRLQENESEFNELLQVHLNKYNKEEIFLKAFRKFTLTGDLKFAVTWSWWAFFGGIAYLVYRKLYSIFIIFACIVMFIDITEMLFILLEFSRFEILQTLLLVFTLVITFAVVMSAKYFYIKKFINDLVFANYRNDTVENVKKRLKYLGGYNNWAILLFILVLLNTVLILVFLHKLLFILRSLL